MIHLYAFMRHTDDIGDSDAPLEIKRTDLDAWEESLQATLAGSATVDMTDDGPTRLLPALAETVRRFDIPQSSLRAVIDGVRMDLEPREYRTFDELAEYCRRVASAVGIACIHIWGANGSTETTDAADRCGIAFQLTNILRDLHEDAARGRVYIPSEDLSMCGLSPERLRVGPDAASLEKLVRLEVDRAKRFYREGAVLAEYLDRDGRRVFGMMMEIYHRLLVQIERDWRELFHRRIGLSKFQKAWIAARWLFFPPRQIHLG